ncbi:MAG: hypothetical protein LUG90_01745 [Clostridiaceae bacterium]|nr:hypothetical protein [Clostridiaceae bacterium]
MGSGQYMYTYLGIFDKIAEWVFSGISKAISWLFKTIFGPIFDAVLNPVATAIVDAVKSAMADAFFYIFQKLLYIVETIERAAKVFSGAEPVTYKGQSWSLINILVFGDGTVGRAMKYMTYIAVLFAFVFAFLSLSRSIFDLETDNRRPIGVVLNYCLKAVISFLLVPVMCMAGFELSSLLIQVTSQVTAPSGGSITMADELFRTCSMGAIKSGKSMSNLTGGLWKNIKSTKEVLDLANVDYITAYICSLFMIWNLCSISFVFIQRMFEMVLLYLASPFFVATMTLDGGEKFQKWKNTFIAKAITGLGTLILLNLFLILVPLVTGGTIVLGAGRVNTSDSGQVAYDALVKLLFLLGAIMAVKNGGALLTTIVDSQTGSAEQATSQQSSAMMAGALLGGARMVRGGAAKWSAGKEQRTMKKEGKAFIRGEKAYKRNERAAAAMEARGDSEGASKLRDLNESSHIRSLERAEKAGLGAVPKDQAGKRIANGKFKLKGGDQMKDLKKQLNRVRGKSGITYHLEHSSKKAAQKIHNLEQNVDEKTMMEVLRRHNAKKNFEEGYSHQLQSIRSSFDKKVSKNPVEEGFRKGGVPLDGSQPPKSPVKKDDSGSTGSDT